MTIGIAHSLKQVWWSVNFWRAFELLSGDQESIVQICFTYLNVWMWARSINIMLTISAQLPRGLATPLMMCLTITWYTIWRNKDRHNNDDDTSEKQDDSESDDDFPPSLPRILHRWQQLIVLWLTMQSAGLSASFVRLLSMMFLSRPLLLMNFWHFIIVTFESCSLKLITNTNVFLHEASWGSRLHDKSHVRDLQWTNEHHSSLYNLKILTLV